jgi:pimeloyl-ACP methyl ester carboxylesterase
VILTGCTQEKNTVHMRLSLLLILLLILGAGAAYAQGDDTPTPSPVPYWPLTLTIRAPDGQPLAADLYLIGPANPTVILLHQLYTDRTHWGDLPGSLLGAGFNVLAVDVRGHGQTGGFVDWDKAIQDTQTWFDWLRANNLGAVVTMGSSMGSSLALVGCGNDALCLGAIAISPGWNYYGINVEQTFSTLLGARPALIVYAHNDHWPSVGVPKMLDVATGDVQVLELPGNAHGMDLFTREDTPMPQIIEWLVAHVG